MKKILIGLVALFASSVCVVATDTASVAHAYYCGWTENFDSYGPIAVGIIGCDTAGVTWYRAKVKCGMMEGANHHWGDPIYPAPTFTYGPKVPLEGSRPYSWVYCSGAYPYVYSSDAEYGNG